MVKLEMTNTNHAQWVLRLEVVKTICSKKCPLQPNQLVGFLMQETDYSEKVCRIYVKHLLMTKELGYDSIKKVLTWEGKLKF